MPSLSIPNIFVPFTRIYSSEVNANFTAISTLLNTTGLDDVNIQDAGLSISKLKVGSGTPGQFISNNGTDVIWASSSVTAQYNVVLGSAADVTNGTATNSTFASIVQADGDRILVLPGYATSEPWVVTKNLYIRGLGSTCIIDGAITFTNTADESQLLFVKVTDDITLDSGADAIHINNIILASGKTFIDNGAANLLEGIQET